VARADEYLTDPKNSWENSGPNKTVPEEEQKVCPFAGLPPVGSAV